MKMIVLPAVTAAAVWLAGPAPANAHPIGHPVWGAPAAAVALGAGVAAGVVGAATYPYGYYDYDDAYAYVPPGMQCGLGWGCQPYPADTGYTYYSGEEYPSYTTSPGYDVIYTTYPRYGGYVEEYPGYSSYGYSGYSTAYPARATTVRLIRHRGYGTTYTRMAPRTVMAPRTAYRAEYRGRMHGVTHHTMVRHIKR